MPTFMTPAEAAQLIRDGDTICPIGFTMVGVAESILAALEQRFLETGSPRGLTLLHSSGQSDRKHGIAHLAHPGLLKRVVGSHWGLCPPLGEMIANNEVECYCLPQGQIAHLLRAMAAGQPGVISRTGLGTFVDPRLEGGKLNERTRSLPDLVRVITIDGEEYLHYLPIPIDVAIIRGTTVDERGNLTAQDELLKLEIYAAAVAARRNGGRVIAQAKHVATAGTLDPHDVVVPGYLIDAVVVCPEPERQHRQTAAFFSDPTYRGLVRPPRSALEPIPLSVRKVIGRRAAQELRPGDIVNLGTGIPGDTIGPVAAEIGLLDQVTLTIESGTIGGVPLGGVDFGIARSPEAVISHANQFDFYNGIGVDITFMGAAQVDAEGNVNASRISGRALGCGGFIDITQWARRVVFCLTLTAHGLEVQVGDGQLHIRQEGEYPKFVPRVDQVTFSATQALRRGQTVLYVTERAVFRLTSAGLVLEEIAPGVDLERDVLAQMRIRPAIVGDLRMMNPDIFR